MCKLEFEHIYDKKAEGAKIRGKCEWYQHREKPRKLFLNIEKQKAINTTIRIHLIDDAKNTDLKFYKNLFIKTVSKSDSERETFLNSVALLNLNSKCFDICESEITKKELITVLKSMSNSKSPGHDGWTKEFYKHF